MNDISTMIKIMEYMALSKPIVQFDLKEGRCSAQDASLYADSRNMVGDFANKLLWLLDHPEIGRSMGEFGRRRVETELAWQYSVPNLLAAYDRAFGKRPDAARWTARRLVESLSGGRDLCETERRPLAASAGEARTHR